MRRDREPDIDLGDGHRLFFYGWGPDRELNQQYAGIPDIAKLGATIEHTRPDGTECAGSVMFDIPEAAALDFKGARWQVESWEPLTLSPSILCKAPLDFADPSKGCCDDHGYIREGRWVRA